MSDEYAALVAKVEAFTSATFARRRSDMACRAGCDGCCHAWLSVSPVETAKVRAHVAALPLPAREALAVRGRRELAREARGEQPARCAMLEDDGTCAVYEARPLVCRTQGHALRYPAGFIPEAAVRSRAGEREVTYCPLNYQADAPRPEDVLDAERVDQILGVVNHRFASAQSVDSHERTGLSSLAAEADVLESQTVSAR